MCVIIGDVISLRKVSVIYNKIYKFNMKPTRKSRSHRPNKSALLARGKIAKLMDIIDDMRKIDIFDEPRCYIEEPGWKHRYL